MPDGWYTIVGPKGGHRTLRIETVADGDGVKQWLAYLSGTDNEGDYTSIGFVRGNEVSLFRKNEGKYQDIVAAARFLVKNIDKLGEFGKAYAESAPASATGAIASSPLLRACETASGLCAIPSNRNVTMASDPPSRVKSTRRVLVCYS